MTSSAKSRLALVALAAVALVTAARGAWAVPAVAEVVAAQVAERWSVNAADVQLDFGRASADVEALPATASCRLAGKGADGYFVCVFRADGAGDVAVRVRAGVRESRPVAARSLAAGATLADGDVTTAAATHWGPPQAASHAAPAAGWVMRRALAAGDPLRDTDATPPSLVQQGQTVRVVWERGAVHLEWAGVALNAARLGGRVRARVEGRTDAVDGVAAGGGVVQLAGSQP